MLQSRSTLSLAPYRAPASSRAKTARGKATHNASKQRARWSSQWFESFTHALGWQGGAKCPTSVGAEGDLRSVSGHMSGRVVSAWGV